MFHNEPSRALLLSLTKAFYLYWEVVFQRLLMNLHTCDQGTGPISVLEYLFKDDCFVNSFGKQRQCLLLEQRAGMLILLPIMKLNSGLLSCNANTACADLPLGSSV